MVFLGSSLDSVGLFLFFKFVNSPHRNDFVKSINKLGLEMFKSEINNVFVYSSGFEFRTFPK